MKGQLLLVRDGLEGAVPSMTRAFNRAGFAVSMASRLELPDAAPADVVLLRIRDHDPVPTLWSLHRQGYRSVIAASMAPSSQECIRLLNAGADYYLDALMDPGELVARVRVALRFSSWLGAQPAIAPVDAGSLYKDALINS
jgi:DNA-binding response OmpR family regulator